MASATVSLLKENQVTNSMLPCPKLIMAAIKTGITRSELELKSINVRKHVLLQNGFHFLDSFSISIRAPLPVFMGPCLCFPLAIECMAMVFGRSALLPATLLHTEKISRSFYASVYEIWCGQTDRIEICLALRVIGFPQPVKAKADRWYHIYVQTGRERRKGSPHKISSLEGRRHASQGWRNWARKDKGILPQRESCVALCGSGRGRSLGDERRWERVVRFGWTLGAVNPAVHPVFAVSNHSLYPDFDLYCPRKTNNFLLRRNRVSYGTDSFRAQFVV
ncbi:hypothetical protein J6590_015811 [Homalodisca vitripennis]|nr:hypothetical protein J6590_015811 [Homalodisca vitripennis]